MMRFSTRAERVSCGVMHHARHEIRDENLYVTFLPPRIAYSYRPPPPPFHPSKPTYLHKPNNYQNKSQASRNEKQTSSFNYSRLRGNYVYAHC